MAWCRQATSHYLSQCWPRSIWVYGITRLQWVNATCVQSTHYWVGVESRNIGPDDLPVGYWILGAFLSWPSCVEHEPRCISCYKQYVTPDLSWDNLIFNRNWFVYAPSQWETLLQCNIISHWLGACTKWSLLQLTVWSMPWLLMAWCYKEPGHQQPWYWSGLSGIYQFQHQGVKHNYFNTLRLVWNGCNFADHIFGYICMKEKLCILI